MSMVQFAKSMDSSVDLHLWNNVTSDDGENSEDLNANRQPWWLIFSNPNAYFDYVSAHPSRNRDKIIEKSRIKGVLKKGFEENIFLDSKSGKEIRDEKTIDEEIESEIFRLKSRLEALKLEKAKMSTKVVEKKDRVVSAKFLWQTEIFFS
ncbi:hypothetical protein CDL12_16095 [Handroanthus impetiginosus]|uniref:Uncharacterized protein n=1 Tax=Handroanthus impetiginosus TaxID=429701 RepID=A0A2G9H195_9LAMI|nr:hypothetical protein CDL12_16095 [Handroanthus impetiginosus]